MEEYSEERSQEVKLIVTEEMRSYIYDITKWARFLAVVGFVFSAFLIIGSFGIGALISGNPQMSTQLGFLGSAGSVIVTFIYLALGLLYFYPSLLLFRVANRGKHAVLFGDQENLNIAMRNLKSLFTFLGVLTIVIIVVYILLIFLAGATMQVA
ncbi:DUF5362 family protein [Pedobacter sp. MW01-1-1]|uniref:DUF5362 family protein n=1 Tax=Pedobacter sp. MW01-1-1 TaxID=3383027 RepID=UPI003FEFF220